ncbi:hypothetical protein ElyMa_002920100, partial [Elysia marginata]
MDGPGTARRTEKSREQGALKMFGTQASRCTPSSNTVLLTGSFVSRCEWDCSM